MSTSAIRQKASTRWLRVLAGTILAGAAALTLGIAGCGGGGGGGGGGGVSGSGKITTGISDPAQECAAPNGPYSAVWVTVSDVQAHIGSGSSQTGWRSLTPGLSDAPVQVNLLGLASPSQDCFLERLGVTSGLPAGNYQQIRVFMVPNYTTLNSGAPNPNGCSGAGSDVWNCVVTSGGTYALDLPSNANTGLKIPPGQIGSGGGLSIVEGQGLDLDIDVNACQSVVQAGRSGKYLFKPTLRADEVGTNPLIAGDIYVADASSGSVTIPTSSPSPVPGAKVWLEHQSTPVAIGSPAASPTPTAEATVDMLDQTTLTDSNGHFEFCPVGTGTYELVASVATMPNSTAPSLATITTNVDVSNSGGPNSLVIPLVPDTVANSTASISGTFETQSSDSSSQGDNIHFAAAQAFNGGTVWALVPEFDNATTNPGGTEPPSVPIGSSSCSAGNCSYDYTLEVPPGNPVIGAASTSGAGYAAPSPAPTPGVYSVWASASNPSSTNADNADCTPSELITDALTLSTATPPVNSNGSLTFQGCSF